jgi:hypothetical protein
MRPTRITGAPAKIGNLACDGRPILGLDSRHLPEITLDGASGCYLIPAHARTGRSPLDPIRFRRRLLPLRRPCRPHIRDRGRLSSDPPANWMCSSADSYRLVSYSDAHSPPMPGREATTFTEPDYFAIARALRTGTGLAGTIEFNPKKASTTSMGTGNAGALCARSEHAALPDLPRARKAADDRVAVFPRDNHGRGGPLAGFGVAAAFVAAIGTGLLDRSGAAAPRRAGAVGAD